MSLNLHCFAEEDIPNKQKLIVQEIINGDYDVIFLQEVAQSKISKKINSTEFVQSDEIRQDNYAYTLLNILKSKGYNYYLIFSISNEAFSVYDEGLCIMSKVPFIDQKAFYVSRIIDYKDWRTRKIISGKIRWNSKIIQLTSVHLGWTDEIEVFEKQVDKLIEETLTDDFSIYAGDFNVPDDSKEHQYLINKMHDSANHLKENDSTHGNHRIDYVMVSTPVVTEFYKTIFKNPENSVSDHKGIATGLKI